MIDQKKILLASFIILISFIVIFSSQFIKFKFKENFEDSYSRFKTIFYNHLVYSSKLENKIHFINNFDQPKDYWPRSGDGNQFGFHPYWSIEKGKFIYDRDNLVFRLSRDIEKYLIKNEININEICKYKINERS